MKYFERFINRAKISCAKNDCLHDTLHRSELARTRIVIFTLRLYVNMQSDNHTIHMRLHCGAHGSAVSAGRINTHSSIVKQRCAEWDRRNARTARASLSACSRVNVLTRRRRAITIADRADFFLSSVCRDRFFFLLFSCFRVPGSCVINIAAAWRTQLRTAAGHRACRTRVHLCRTTCGINASASAHWRVDATVQSTTATVDFIAYQRTYRNRLCVVTKMSICRLANAIGFITH